MQNTVGIKCIIFSVINRQSNVFCRSFNFGMNKFSRHANQTYAEDTFPQLVISAWSDLVEWSNTWQPDRVRGAIFCYSAFAFIADSHPGRKTSVGRIFALEGGRTDKCVPRLRFVFYSYANNAQTSSSLSNGVAPRFCLLILVQLLLMMLLLPLRLLLSFHNNLCRR